MVTQASCYPGNVSKNTLYASKQYFTDGWSYALIVEWNFAIVYNSSFSHFTKQIWSSVYVHIALYVL